MPVRLAVWLTLVPALAFAQKPPRCPNMVVVFDSSSSMAQKVQASDGGTAAKYVVGTEAVGQITQQNQSHIRFGLELFPDNSVAGGCTVSSGTCSYPTPGCHSVFCDFNTATGILAELGQSAPGGGHTPTATGLLTAGFRPDMQDLTRTRYALLVTDGLPSGCTPAPLPDALNALDNLRTDAGIKTFVIGFSLPDGGGNQAMMDRQLSEMAVHGGEPRYASCDAGSDAGTCYYKAQSSQDIQAALAAIVSVVEGELGSVTCDPTCYAEGCDAGQACVGSACVADPCAGVTCAAGSACVAGTCQAACTVPCPVGQHCANGACVADMACTPACQGTNQTCVGGQCVEDYCSGNTLTVQCPPGDVCIQNGCQPPRGSSGGDGGQGGTDGGGGGNGTKSASSCCTGAPGAFSAAGLLLVLLARALRRARGARAD